jgi:tellurite methyltransferase
MAAEDRIRWDGIYRQNNDSAAYPPPDPLLFEYALPTALQASTREAYRALDLASGVGQNGLWLATQGYTVDLIDVSRVALLRARAEAERRQLHNLNILQVDVTAPQLAAHLLPARYDLVCVFRYLRRDLFPLLADTVQHGGRLIYESLNRRYLERVPQFNPDFLMNC